MNPFLRRQLRLEDGTGNISDGLDCLLLRTETGRPQLVSWGAQLESYSQRDPGDQFQTSVTIVNSYCTPVSDSRRTSSEKVCRVT